MNARTDILFIGMVAAALGLMAALGLLLGPEEGREADSAPVTRPPLPDAPPSPEQFEKQLEIRLTAAADSAGAETKAGIERLVSVLGSREGGFEAAEETRKSLIGRGEASVRALANVLRYGSKDAKQEAASILGAIGSNLAVHALAQGLEDESYEVQASCMDTLGLIGDMSAVPDLLRWQFETAQRKRPARIAAARALCRLGNSSGLPVLVNALYWDVFSISAADEALRECTGLDFKLNPYALRPEREQSADAWAAWFHSKGVESSPGRPKLDRTDAGRLAFRIEQEIARMGGERYYFAQKAKETLSAAWDLTGPYVLKALYAGSPAEEFHPSFHVRLGACHVIEMTWPSRGPVPGCAEHLAYVLATDANASVRAAAAQALGRAGDRRSIRALLDALKSDRDVSTRIEAAVSLGRLGFDDAGERLRGLLAAPDLDGELMMEIAWAAERVSGGPGLGALASHFEKGVACGDMSLAERAHRRLVEETRRNPVETRSIPSLGEGERRDLIAGWKRAAAKRELLAGLKAAVAREDAQAAASAVKALESLFATSKARREAPPVPAGMHGGDLLAYWEAIVHAWAMADKIRDAADKSDYIKFAHEYRKLSKAMAFEEDCHPGMESQDLMELAARAAAWAAGVDPF